MKKRNSILIVYVILLSIVLLTGCAFKSSSLFAGANKYSNTTNSTSIAATQFDIASVPAYSGSPYIEINNNEPYFEVDDKKNTGAFEIYTNLDSLGRCGVAYANICKELMPTEERGEIGNVRPSGWHTANYHGLIEDNYLYNRCHLIAFRLAGENANEKNLITGTRYMNTEGMLPFENEVGDYVRVTDNHVLYRVTPVFEGNNLVASGVLMEAYSIEDNGAGIEFCVFCYNVQPGIDIDYATGDSQVSDDAAYVKKSGNATDAAKQSNDTENVTADYVLNTNTKKFHLPDCDSVSDMKEKNKKYYSGSRDELISQGYSPCGACKP